MYIYIPSIHSMILGSRLRGMLCIRVLTFIVALVLISPTRRSFSWMIWHALQRYYTRSLFEWERKSIFFGVFTQLEGPSLNHIRPRSALLVFEVYFTEHQCSERERKINQFLLTKYGREEVYLRNEYVCCFWVLNSLSPNPFASFENQKS